MISKLSLLVFLILLCCYVKTESEEPIFYHVPDNPLDTRSAYPVELLKLVLSNSGTSRPLKEFRIEAEQDRVLKLLREGVVDVFWSGASNFRNEEFTAIRYPIFKGLLGYRLILLKKSNVHLLKNVKALEQLRAFTVGQGGDWPDRRIFSENGFVIQTTTSYEGLFNMLSKHRFDLFPRSVVEVWQELDNFSYYDIALDPYLLLRYQYAMFYYVRNTDEQLAEDLEKGFSTVIKNGQFDQLFNQYHNKFIEKADLYNRWLIEISNPLFGPLPENKKHLYFELYR